MVVGDVEPNTSLLSAVYGYSPVLVMILIIIMGQYSWDDDVEYDGNPYDDEYEGKGYYGDDECGNRPANIIHGWVKSNPAAAVLLAADTLHCIG